MSRRVLQKRYLVIVPRRVKRFSQRRIIRFPNPRLGIVRPGKKRDMENVNRKIKKFSDYPAVHSLDGLGRRLRGRGCDNRVDGKGIRLKVQRAPIRRDGQGRRGDAAAVRKVQNAETLRRRPVSGKAQGDFDRRGRLDFRPVGRKATNVKRPHILKGSQLRLNASIAFAEALSRQFRNVQRRSRRNPGGNAVSHGDSIACAVGGRQGPRRAAKTRQQCQRRHA